MARITGLNRRKGQAPAKTDWKKKISIINQNGSINKYRKRSLSNYVGLFIVSSILILFIIGAVFGWIFFIHDVRTVDEETGMVKPLEFVKRLRNAKHNKGEHDHLNDHVHIGDDDDADDGDDRHGDGTDGTDGNDHDEGRTANHEKGKHDGDGRYDHVPDDHDLDKGHIANHEKGKHDDRYNEHFIEDLNDVNRDENTLSKNDVSLNISGKLFPYFGTAKLNQLPKGGGRFEEFKDGDCSYLGSEKSDKLARKRRTKIKGAMIHAWRGYEENAFGSDVLMPIEGRGRQNWGNTAATMLDSLDTLWLMDMKDEFYRARDWIRDHLDFSQSVGYVSVFEVTIRCLGGLLSAYDWSHDEVFLEKAKSLGEGLFKAFPEDERVYPDKQVLLGKVEKEGDSLSDHDKRNDISHHRSDLMRHMERRHGGMHGGKSGGPPSLAEVGTIQIEFRFLAKATGIEKFAEKVNAIFEDLESTNPENGLYGTMIRRAIGGRPIGGRSKQGLAHHQAKIKIKKSKGRNLVEIKKNPNSHRERSEHKHRRHGMHGEFGHHHGGGNKITFGGNADSFYEYMLKIWIQGDKKEPMYRDMYDKAIDGLHSQLLRQSLPSGLWFVGEGHGNKMDHLACFTGGLLALGAYTDPLGLESERAKRDLKTARALAYTCYQMYALTPTGLSPETVYFNTEHDSEKDMQQSTRSQHYLLRPEAVETFFVLHQLTGDPMYREWGWEIFLSIDYYCKTEYGYGSYPNVNDVKRDIKDEMESFFLAETLKYLYLLMDPDTEVDILHKHVFNTEAHPLRKFSLQQT